MQNMFVNQSLFDKRLNNPIFLFIVSEVFRILRYYNFTVYANVYGEE